MCHPTWLLDAKVNLCMEICCAISSPCVVCPIWFEQCVVNTNCQYNRVSLTKVWTKHNCMLLECQLPQIFMLYWLMSRFTICIIYIMNSTITINLYQFCVEVENKYARTLVALGMGLIFTLSLGVHVQKKTYIDDYACPPPDPPPPFRPYCMTIPLPALPDPNLPRLTLPVLFISSQRRHLMQRGMKWMLHEKRSDRSTWRQNASVWKRRQPKKQPRRPNKKLNLPKEGKRVLKERKVLQGKRRNK